MIPEVVGRFPICCSFHSLDENAFIRVMREPQNSLIHQAQRQFAIDSIKLEVTDAALCAIAALAVQRKTGARALSETLIIFNIFTLFFIGSIFEKVLLQAKYECPGNEIEVLIINKETVDSQGQHFTVIKKGDIENRKLV